MARTFRRKERLHPLTELNLTPLMDLICCLLIVFMVSAPVIEQTVPLKLPSETCNAQSPVTKEITQTLSIDSNGTYFCGTQPVTLAILDQQLAQWATQPDAPILHIRADAHLPYQKVIDLLDLIKQHHLTKISLDTQPK